MGIRLSGYQVCPDEKIAFSDVLVTRYPASWGTGILIT